MMTMLPVMLLKKGRQLQIDHAAGRKQHAAAKRHLPPKQKRHHSGPDRRERLQRLWLDRPWTVVGVTVAFCLLAAIKLPVPFDYNLLHMQSQGLPSVVYERKLIDSAEKSVLYAASMVDSPEQAVKLVEKIQKLPSVATNDSMAEFLTQDPGIKLGLIHEIRQQSEGIRFQEPDGSPADLTSLAQRLYGLEGYMGLAADEVKRQTNFDRKIWDNLMGLRSAVQDLRIAMSQGDRKVNAAKIGSFQYALLDDVRDTFESLQGQDDTSGLTADDLPPALKNRFIGVTGKHLIQIYPKNDVWEHDVQEKFVHELQTVDPKVTGTPVQLYYYTDLLRSAYVHASGWALLAILILVFIHFRSLSAVLLAMLPVGIGALWMVGFMGWAHIPFNPANIMTLPLVIGIGVTNGIHILNRFAEEHDPGILAKSTGKAVLVSGMTTIAGFGSLTVADHEGIKSLGWVMAVGVTTCMVAGLTFLPALLILMRKKGTAEAESLNPKGS
jgi:predicted RND superfamily exporter protein